MKKVLIVASWYPSADRPLNGIFVQEQAAALAKAYDVTVFAPRLISWSETLYKKLYPQSGWYEQTGIKVYRAEKWTLPKLPFHKKVHLYCGLFRRGLQQILAQWGKPDIVHAHIVLVSGWIAAKVGQEYKLPVVLTEHSSPFGMHLDSKQKQQLVQETLVAVKRVIAVSPSLAKQICSFYQDVHIRSVPNLVRTDFFVPSVADGIEPSTQKITFLCIALLTPRKGITFLLEAIHRLLRQGFHSFKVIIGGDGPERVKLEQEAQKQDILHHCQFLGFLDRLEVKHWMQQCDVFILPSLAETFGIVCAEAMACGKPVIATRCGGPEYVVTPETGLLVDVADPAALAAAMQKFICGEVAFDPQTIRHSVVERFGEAAFLRNLTTVYEEVWAEA